MATNTITQRIALVGSEEVRKQLESIGKSGEQAFKQLGDAQKAVTTPARQLAGELRQVEITIRAVGDATDRTTGQLDGFKTRLAVAATAAVAAGVAIARFATNALRNAEALRNEAAALGLTAAQYDRYKKAAYVAGVESKDLAKAFQKIQQDITAASLAARNNVTDFVETAPGQWKRGADAIAASTLQVGDAFTTVVKGVQITRIATKENLAEMRRLDAEHNKLSSSLGKNADAYAEFDVRLLKGRDTARTLGEVLEDISKRIRETGDQAEQVRIAERFGLTDLIPLLADSKTGLDDLLTTLKGLAVPDNVKNSLAEQAREFNKQLRLIEVSMQLAGENLAVSFGQLFDKPLKAIIADLKAGTTDASTAVSRSLSVLSAIYGGLKARFEASLAAAFKQPLTDLLVYIDKNSGQIDAALGELSKTMGDFATDVVRVFAFTFKDGKFQFIRDEDAKVQYRWLITLREAFVSIGTAVDGAWKKYIQPAFTKITEYSQKVVKAINSIFGTDLKVGEIAVLAILAQITGLLSPIIALSKAAAIALLAVVAPAAGLATVFSVDLSKSIEEITADIIQFFGFTRSQAFAFVEEIKRAFGELGDLFGGSGDTGPSAGNALPTVNGQQKANPYSRSIAPPKEEVQEQVKDANALSKAWAAVSKEIEGFGANLKALLDTLAPIGRALLDSFNWLFGTNFSPVQAGILLVVLQLTGLLRTLLAVASTAATVFAGVTFGILNLIKSATALTAIFNTLTFGSLTALLKYLDTLSKAAAVGVLGSFRKLGTFIGGTFGRSVLGTLGRILAVFTRFLSLPGLIVGALVALIAYWDDVKKLGEAAANYVRDRWAEVWGDTTAAKNGLKDIAAEHQKYFRRVPQEQKSYWDQFIQQIRQSWAQLRADIQKTFAPDETAQSGWKNWFTRWAAEWLLKIDEIKKAFSNIFKNVNPESLEFNEFGNKLKDGQLELESFGDTGEEAFGKIEQAAYRAGDATVDTTNVVEPWARAYALIYDLFVNRLPSDIANGMAAAAAAAEAAAVRIEAAAARIVAAAARAAAAAASMNNSGSSSNSFAVGGYVSGPGTPTSDSIPAWLSDGEFVLRAAAVRKYGLSLLYALNGLKVDPRKFKGWPGFAMGGLVSSANRSIAPLGAQPALITPQMPGKSFDLIIDGQRFGQVLAGEDVAGDLMRYATSAKMRSGGRKPGWYR